MKRLQTSLITALLLLLCSSVSAQKKGYEPGYIITLEGERLNGYVKDRTPEPFVDLYERIRFVPEGKRRKRKYRPEDISGYGIGNRDYVSRPFREEAAFFKFRYYTGAEDPPTFLRVMRSEGPLRYYLKEFVHDDNNFVDDFPLFHREGHTQMVRVTQGILGLKRQQLINYFADCPALVEAIASKELQDPDAVYEFYLEHCANGLIDH